MTPRKQRSLTCSFLFFCFCILTATAYGKAPSRSYYQIKVYHLKSSAQQQRVEKFLETAYLPALRRTGIKTIGVFKTMETDTVKRIYVFIPYRNWKQIEETELALQKDQRFKANGKGYLDASYDNQPYERIETTILRAFEGMPQPFVPQLTGPRQDRVYELRSYESATETYFANKVKMFNSGEIDLFKRLGFNALFYGEAVAGANMPNLMYMTSFENKASRDEHWKSFGNDPFWKELSALPEYQHNVSRIFIYFLYPAAYSDF